MSSVAPTPNALRWQQRWQRFSAASVRAYHAYAGWLVGLSWRRFIVYALLLLIVVGIVHDMPPFTWKVTQTVEDTRPRVAAPLPPPAAPGPAAPPPAPPAAQPGAQREFPIRIDTPKPGERTDGVEIAIGKDGIRVTPKPAARAASAADAAASAAADARRAAAAAASAAAGGIRITVPEGAGSEAVREAVAQAKRDIEEAVRQARKDAEQAVRDAEEARRDAEAALEAMSADEPRVRTRVVRYGPGEYMGSLAVLWVLGSAILKYTYKGRLQAERQAAQATETAEAESLRRQVVEARMAAMQAQVEPHFLFNTLASIDHLIETDPARASQMQKNLIALLRASMPTMREASGTAGGANGVRDLGREIAVIRPYLEILKVRMEERLAPRIEVPDGLLSAEFPPMMIQTLVENAIKHGLEPKAEGGELLVKAEIVHGKLQVTVADTGLGFGKAPTGGTGVGLANIRERLQLLYGAKAVLTVAENSPGGTRVTITVPYKTVEEAMA
jgi:signal transduction histidine kinase